MTLTAITDDGVLLTPYLMFSKSVGLTQIRKDIKRVQGSGDLHCPDCLQRFGMKEIVKFRGTDPEHARPHFYHINSQDTPSQCSNHSGESQKHLLAKTAIQNHYQAEGAIVHLEQTLSNGLRSRRPDVWVAYLNGVNEAHEIQLSPITFEELAERSLDLISLGCHRVFWYLPPQKITDEILVWAYDKMVVINKLTFSDELIPKWSEQKESTKKRKKTVSSKALPCQRESPEGIPFSDPPIEYPEQIHLLNNEQNQLARDCRKLIERLWQENWSR